MDTSDKVPGQTKPRDEPETKVEYEKTRPFDWTGFKFLMYD